MKSNNERFVYEVEARDAQYIARKPFKVERREKRAFIRIEISSPLSLNTIRSRQQSFNPDGDGSTIKGTILNISSGGVLAEINQQLTEGDIVSMRFTLQDELELDRVLGVVKRCDSDNEGAIVGIEFVSDEKLCDLLSTAEIDLLKDKFTDFSSGVNRLLSGFINENNRMGDIIGDESNDDS